MKGNFEAGFGASGAGLGRPEKSRHKVGVNSGLVMGMLYLYNPSQLEGKIQQIKNDGGRALDLLLAGVEPEKLKGIYTDEEIDEALAARASDFTS